MGRNMRLRGWRYLGGAPHQIIYDRATGKTLGIILSLAMSYMLICFDRYLTGLTRAISRDPGKTTPITEASGTVWEFGLNVWRW